jgi:alpha-tubulin suppressor-like RCC1 family protein
MQFVVNIALPNVLQGNQNFRQISSLMQTTYGITTQNEVYAWGNNQNAQLGIGDSKDRTTPTKIPGFVNILQISAGHFHVIALQQGGTMFACGFNNVSILH